MLGLRSTLKAVSFAVATFALGASLSSCSGDATTCTPNIEFGLAVFVTDRVTRDPKLIGLVDFDDQLRISGIPSPKSEPLSIARSLGFPTSPCTVLGLS